MTKILGLDLGTNSIGWAIVETEDKKNFTLLQKGVRIFQEGVKIEKGNEISRAAERTKYRSARRMKFRRRLRKIKTLEVLTKYNYCPYLSKDDLNLWRNKKIYPSSKKFRAWLLTNESENRNPYFFRAIAAEKKLNLLEEKDRFMLGRAFYHIAQRRGFLSNRLETSKESEGDVSQKINEINEKKGDKTLGQYFYELNNKGVRVRANYTSRNDHYLEEFNRICSVQEIPDTIKNELFKAIFFQRPLKSQKGLVGKCPFEKNKSRCSVSHPLFEEFRMLSFINNIKIRTPEDEKLRPLTKNEIDIIMPLFYRKSKEHFRFEEICKKIIGKKKNKKIPNDFGNNKDFIFNYKFNTSVSGCRTIACLIDVFGDNWKEKIYEIYSLKNCKRGIKDVEEVINDVWHVLQSYDNNIKIFEFGKTRLNLDDDSASKFSKITLKQDYGSLSLKAIKKILPFLRKGYNYSHSVFLANIDEVVSKSVVISSSEKNIIENEINHLIDQHALETKISEIVNSIIKSSRDNSYKWSDNDFVKDSFKKDILEKLECHYGIKTFNSFPQGKKLEILQKTTKTFSQQMQKNFGKGEFLKIGRIDERIIEYLSERFGGKINPEKLYHPSAIEIYKPAPLAMDGNRYLQSPRVASIKNPMAMRTLHQLKYLVNELIEYHIIDQNTRINIEMARELNDTNQRKALRYWQNERETKRKEYYDNIKQLFKAETNREIEPSEEDILKYQLWEEQDHICLYTGEQIGITEFIGANPKYDIEHTIPRSLSLDNSQENLTLCNSRFNREIKKNKLPSELSNHTDILARLEKWSERVQELENKIEKAKIGSRSSLAKEQRDFYIQRKHRLMFEKNYWKGKYDRFKMNDVPEFFKKSQLVDTGLITRYSSMFLHTVFEKVYPIKGSIVADYRKIWGLQKEYEHKSRINHIHHCIDAIVIACITRENYDLLANYYHELKQWELGQNSLKPKNLPKPWDTFTEDIKKIENEVLVSHYTPDRVHVQKKSKLRKKGKIIRNHAGEILYQQGDTVRGPLHKETYYGAIKKLSKNNSDDVNEVKYVVRKELSSLESCDIKNIVDNVVKTKIEDAIARKGFIKGLSEPIWMNEKKNIQIKKVRCFIPSVTNPIHLKAHRDKSDMDYKQFYHVMNDRNYLMAIYEEPVTQGKIAKREFELINYLKAGQYFKPSNRNNAINMTLVPENHLKTGWPLKQIIKIGDLVILWEDSPKEIRDCSQTDLVKRLYKVVSLSIQIIKNKYHYGTIVLKHHQDAQQSSELKIQDGKFTVKEKLILYRKLNHNQFNALIEEKDFELSISGQLTFK